MSSTGPRFLLSSGIKRKRNSEFQGTDQAKKEEAHQEEIKLGKKPIVDKSPPRSPPPKQASKSLMIQQDQNLLTKIFKDYNEAMILKISALQLQYQQLDSDTDYSDSNSSSELVSENQSEEENLSKVLQTHPKVEQSDDEEMQEVPDSSSSQQRSTQKPSIGRIIFTLDDIPQGKWPDRIQKFHSSLETRKLTEDSNYNILMEFVSRFMSMVRDWWNLISQHDQMQFLVLQDLAQPI
ncbi:hypothetical protein PVK06_041894 [Gossypium arboreum]|uniref:Uncharacterized protein n=1 Tax=Gossypium arboreum TaxID=29729 RepID=A0ABR0N9H5_GOSAR|nr:hypothetical protein PVK06_041894 [Gossypium arboreum]